MQALQRAGIAPGFGFLRHATGFQIGEAPILFTAGCSYLRAIVEVLLNTLKVAVAGSFWPRCLVSRWDGAPVA
ncbi:hypothetical protein [Paenirhodobacter sp.]|uniref:hypothetical protein n=1 Tax=Paenirhodobacter sp. TaxID=1965326 RepID=UPI003B3E6C6E